MNQLLTIAASLFLLLGLAHSYLGERYILIRLFRRQDLPHLFGSDLFTRGTLRMAWHLTTVATFMIAALLLVAARRGAAGVSQVQLGIVVGCGSLICAVLAAVGTRGRHLSWVVLLAIAVLSWLGTR